MSTAQGALGSVVAADLYRYAGRTGFRAFLGHFLRVPGFRYTALLRCCQHLRGSRLRYPLFAFCSLWLTRVGRIYGIELPILSRVGPGLYIGHYGGIVVNADAVLGANCNLSHGVTIGQTNRGARQGVPTIGDSVYIGPGAVIIGRLSIGDGAAVGANAVVTADVPAGAAVAGVPARVVSSRGSEGYIQNPVSRSGAGSAPSGQPSAGE